MPALPAASSGPPSRTSSAMVVEESRLDEVTFEAPHPFVSLPRGRTSTSSASSSSAMVDVGVGGGLPRPAPVSSSLTTCGSAFLTGSLQQSRTTPTTTLTSGGVKTVSSNGVGLSSSSLSSFQPSSRARSANPDDADLVVTRTARGRSLHPEDRTFAQHARFTAWANTRHAPAVEKPRGSSSSAASSRNTSPVARKTSGPGSSQSVRGSMGKQRLARESAAGGSRAGGRESRRGGLLQRGDGTLNTMNEQSSGTINSNMMFMSPRVSAQPAALEHSLQIMPSAYGDDAILPELVGIVDEDVEEDFFQPALTLGNFSLNDDCMADAGSSVVEKSRTAANTITADDTSCSGDTASANLPSMPPILEDQELGPDHAHNKAPLSTIAPDISYSSTCFPVSGRTLTLTRMVSPPLFGESNSGAEPGSVARLPRTDGGARKDGPGKQVFTLTANTGVRLWDNNSSAHEPHVALERQASSSSSSSSGGGKPRLEALLAGAKLTGSTLGRPQPPDATRVAWKWRATSGSSDDQLLEKTPSFALPRTVAVTASGVKVNNSGVTAAGTITAKRKAASKSDDEGERVRKRVRLEEIRDESSLLGGAGVGARPRIIENEPRVGD